MQITSNATPTAEQSLCAVVVTFHPEPETVSNFRLLKEQVSQFVVVDNGSSETSLKMLRAASEEIGFVLLDNDTNVGIATALNRGVRWALDRSFAWIILFDQDSSITPGFIDAMFHGYEQHPTRDKVAIFCPCYTDRLSRTSMPSEHLSDRSLEVARTSGSLMPAGIFAHCGFFLESLFIDQVDYEYSLRVRKQGYLVAECTEATLLHSLGAPKVYTLLGFRLFKTTNHKPARRYYLIRNRVFLARQYWRTFPGWCIGMCLATLKETIKIVCVEQFRWLKLWSTWLGIRDGLRGRMGLTQKL